MATDRRFRRLLRRLRRRQPVGFCDQRTWCRMARGHNGGCQP